MFFKSRLEHLIYSIVFLTAAVFLLLLDVENSTSPSVLLFSIVGFFNLILFSYKVFKKVPEKASIKTYLWWNLGYGLLFLTLGTYLMIQNGGSLNSLAIQCFMLFGSVEAIIFVIKVFKLGLLQTKN